MYTHARTHTHALLAEVITDKKQAVGPDINDAMASFLRCYENSYEMRMRSAEFSPTNVAIPFIRV